MMQFLRDESGATAIEYGLIAAMVGVAIMASLQVLAVGVGDTFGVLDTAMQDAAPTANQSPQPTMRVSPGLQMSPRN